MKKAIGTGLTWAWYLLVELLHWIIYMAARTLKTPCWWITIDEFALRRDWREEIDRDLAIVTALTLTTIGFMFLSWWLFLIITAIAILNFGVFFIWMFRRSRKNDSDINTEIAVLKSNVKNKFRRK